MNYINDLRLLESQIALGLVQGSDAKSNSEYDEMIKKIDEMYDAIMIRNTYPHKNDITQLFSRINKLNTGEAHPEYGDLKGLINVIKLYTKIAEGSTNFTKEYKKLDPMTLGQKGREIFLKLAEEHLGLFDETVVSNVQDASYLHQTSGLLIDFKMMDNSFDNALSVLESLFSVELPTSPPSSEMSEVPSNVPSFIGSDSETKKISRPLIARTITTKRLKKHMKEIYEQCISSDLSGYKLHVYTSRKSDYFKKPGQPLFIEPYGNVHHFGTLARAFLRYKQGRSYQSKLDQVDPGLLGEKGLEIYNMLPRG